MCGIVGVIDQGNKDLRERAVRDMNSAIFHRGPDDEGLYSDDLCTLAMRRLAIIDLDNGKQPIYSDCCKYLIFFNGEIYNYLELKDLLLTMNCVFRNNSDTEVVVNLYKYFGKEMLNKLSGMFAFCIYNIETKHFFFARDRFGEKPFYYYNVAGQFIFSSEIKSLLSSKLFSPKLNRSKLGSYIRLSYVDEPFTLLENVHTLPPGKFLEIDHNLNINVGSFINFKAVPDNSIKTIDEAAEFIKPYFVSAVKKQMISDVPIGAFLSGGIDSSSIVATMAELSSKPLKTYTVKFKTNGYDESKIARLVANKFQTEHNEIVVESSQFKSEQFWKIIDHVGLPFPDSSAIPTDIVTSEISKYVKVALSGDGGDEVFGGYTVFDWISKLNSLSYIPKRISGFSYHGISSLNEMINSNKLRQFCKALKISQLSTDRLIQETHALFDMEEVQLLREVELDYPIFKDYNSLESLLRNTMNYRIKFDLPLDMLIKVDRMSMANSLEVRSPFLDPDLYEASLLLPEQFLRHKGLGKVVIRRMMKNCLPEEVFNHPKSGFSIPLHDFRNNDFKVLAEELILEKHMIELFNIDSLKKILHGGLYESTNNGSGSIYRKTHQLWSLMMLSGWIKRFNISI
jgi:asparagine synthase (glutamine-hydrolysing)